MKVLHINTTANTGGAARAMRRLGSALEDQGHQSRFLVGRSSGPAEAEVYLIWDLIKPYQSLLNRLQSRVGNQLEGWIGIHPWANRPAINIAKTELYRWADLIDLRNLFGGFFNLWCLPSLSASKPVVWRLPDMWALTGHCAYPYTCQRWKTGCRNCPLLTGSGRRMVEPQPTRWDGTRRVWRAKRDLYRQSRLHVVVTTEWMREQVQASILGDALSVTVISNGVSLAVYRPRPREEARRRLGLDPARKYLLWAAGGKGNYRKGYHLALEAMQQLQGSDEQAPTLLTMGGNEGWSQEENLSQVHHFGYIREPEKQAVIYAAADGFLCTTLADAQPQTALESLASGTPVIAFDVGPMPEIVREGETGLIAPSTTAASLRETIEAFFNQSRDMESLSRSCRQAAEEKYDLDRQTGEYIRLYRQILNEGPPARA